MDFTGVEWIVVLNDPDNSPDNFNRGPTLVASRTNGIVTDEGKSINTA